MEATLSGLTSEIFHRPLPLPWSLCSSHRALVSGQMYDHVALLSTKREMYHLDVLKLGGTSGELGQESTKTHKVLAYVPGAASTNPNSLSRR
jgi:hypothetical protein